MIEGVGRSLAIVRIALVRMHEGVYLMKEGVGREFVDWC
jgi:hypothetical protein